MLQRKYLARRNDHFSLLNIMLECKINSGPKLPLKISDEFLNNFQAMFLYTYFKHMKLRILQWMLIHPALQFPLQRFIILVLSQNFPLSTPLSFHNPSLFGWFLKKNAGVSTPPPECFIMNIINKSELFYFIYNKMDTFYKHMLF